MFASELAPVGGKFLILRLAEESTLLLTPSPFVAPHPAHHIAQFQEVDVVGL